jgi:hypothetical protein
MAYKEATLTLTNERIQGNLTNKKLPGREQPLVVDSKIMIHLSPALSIEIFALYWTRIYKKIWLYFSYPFDTFLKMENEIYSKPSRDNANSKPDHNLSSRSIGEGAKPQENNNQASNKRKDDPKDKLKIPHQRIWKFLREPKLTDWIVALATAAIFVTSLLQWRAISGQWGEMQSGSKQTDRLIKEANRIANSMEKTSEESKRALDATIGMARRDQRAWVGPIEVVPAWREPTNKPIYIKDGFPAKFEVVITNSGKSPARKVRTWIQFDTIPADRKFSPNYGLPQKQSVSVIQPQQRFTLPTSSLQPVNASDIDTIKNGKAILYLFGKITYEDIFKTQHSTTFCMTLAPSLDGFAACDAYNEAD